MMMAVCSLLVKEVAEKLGYSNPHKAIRDHCKGVSRKRSPPFKGGMQTVKLSQNAMFTA